jgi:hypothetical protein
MEDFLFIFLVREDIWDQRIKEGGKNITNAIFSNFSGNIVF